MRDLSAGDKDMVNAMEKIGLDVLRYKLELFFLLNRYLSDKRLIHKHFEILKVLQTTFARSYQYLFLKNPSHVNIQKYLNFCSPFSKQLYLHFNIGYYVQEGRWRH